MKTLVVYDSLYGNTRVIAQAIAEAISGEVEMRHVNDVNIAEVGAYNLLIVGAPTQGAAPSPAVKEMLQALPEQALRGIEVAAFDTRLKAKWARLFGFAAPKIARGLQNKGGSLVVPGEGFFVTGGEGPLAEGEVERASAWARKIFEQVDR